MEMYPDSIKNLKDRDLLNRCLEGDESAWQIFYNRFFRLIKDTIKRTSCIYRIDLNQEDQKEYEQSIWALFQENDYRKLRGYRGINNCSVASWLRTCTTRATINFLVSLNRRDRLNSQNFAIADASSAGNQMRVNPEEEIATRELLDRIIQIIEKDLSVREKFFATLFWFDELTYKEISVIMNPCPPDLHLLKHRIVKKIKRLLKKIPSSSQ